MSARLAGCEGGCGVVGLTAEMREVSEDGVTTVLVHTVERCRLLRTLREAGLAAIGSNGTCDVLASAYPPAFIVRVVRSLPRSGLDVEMRLMVAEEYAWSFPARDLYQLGWEVTEHLRRAIEHPESIGSVGLYWSQQPVIARDPSLR